MKVIYKFEQQQGRLQDGYTILDIVDGLAETTNAAEKALAERYGGQPVPKPAKPESAKAADDKPRGKEK